MISKFFIDRPRFAIVISIVITLVGLIAINTLPVAQYPDITPPQVTVSTVYPGASAETVQKTVIEPIENQINGVENMLYMSSQSDNSGSATITVTFKIGSDPDMNTVNTQNRVAIANPQLPAEVKKQGVTVMQRSPNMLLIINLFSPHKSYDGIYLSNYARINILNQIARLDGVGQAAILGELSYSMRVWLDPDRMTSLKMSVDEVIKAIESQNIQAASGQIGASPSPKNQQFQYVIQTKGRLSDVKEFANIIIRSEPDGSMVRIKDIAKVELGSQSYSSFGELNGNPGVVLAVYQLSDANGLKLAADIRREMKKLSRRFPADLKWAILYDTTKFVSKSIDEVLKTLYIAVAMVVLVIFIFLQDWRSTLIPAIAIPVSLIGTFAFLAALNFSINTTTLFGLILAIGIVVDDAIVVIENVNRLMEKEGLGAKEAAKKTMEQVTGPIVATTLVLMAVFVPVAFLPGITGELYRQFAVTISISVLISSVNALTLSPALCGCLLKPGKKKPWKIFLLYNRFFSWLTSGYITIVSLLLRRAFMVAAVFAILMGVTYYIYGVLPTGFVPNEDQGAFFVDIELPDAASQDRTYKVVRQVQQMVKNTAGVKDVIAVTGFSLLTSTSASNVALMVVVLDDWDKRKSPELQVDGLIRHLQHKLDTIPAARIFAFSPSPIPGIGTTGGFSFELQSVNAADPGALAEVARGLIFAANKQPEIAQAYTTYRAGVPQLFLNIDREKVRKLGIELTEVFKTLQVQLGSFYVNDFNKFGQVYQVNIQADKQYRCRISDIGRLYVRNKRGEMVPLSTLLTVTTRFGPEFMDRYNMYSSVTINGRAAKGYSSGQAIKAMERAAAESLPPGYTYAWTDMSYQEILAGNQVVIIFLLALVFIYLFLVAQYESWMLPLSIMFSVPVAFFGALAALMLSGLDNNIYTQVGFVLLFGLASKTAILIVEFAKEQHVAGKSVFDAAIFAARLRFRAVVMTAVSFILGVFPLVVASGAGAASRRSLGTAVFGGMLVACVFGTILIPAFYLIIQKIVERSFSYEKKE